MTGLTGTEAQVLTMARRVLADIRERCGNDHYEGRIEEACQFSEDAIMRVLFALKRHGDVEAAAVLERPNTTALSA